MTVLWPAHALLAATGGTCDSPFEASGVSIDTRTLRPGELFVALVGEHGDGHDHVAAALTAGAAGVLAHRPTSAPRTILVEDTLAALHRLGAAGRARFTGRLVAVTGSVGKTSTKEMLRAMLAAQGATHAAQASYNNHWGVPLTLALLPPAADWCVAEIGMNHAGEIAPLARLARPHVAVITAIEPAHLGPLGSLEAIADEKASIARGLLPGGTIVLPAGHRLLPRLLAAVHDARVVTFGYAPEADLRLLACDGDATGSQVTAQAGDIRLDFRLGAPGRHMALNALAALAAVRALGGDMTRAAAALADFTPVTGRGACRPILGGAATLLDESYNASPAAVRAALAVLRLIPAERRLAVLGDMLELGEAGPAEHAGLAGDVAAHADLLFTCGTLTTALREAMPPPRRGAHAADSQALAPLVAAAVQPGDAVLVKGSLGSRMRHVVAALDALAPARAGSAA
jgi:UDP-N-acetylmuramoyl-tripeptide--D-alanyl-D-alanine ligase